MSTAANRNFAAAQRERNRRVALSLDDPSFLAVTGDPAGDAFFGSLHDKADAARAAGMGFRADLSSIGRDDVPMQGGGRLTATDRAGIAGNIGLGQLTDANAIRQLTMNRLNSARQDEIVDSLRASDQDRQLAEAFATPERASITTETTGPDGKTAFAIRNAGPETERQRMLATAPPPMRPTLMAQWAAQDAAAQKAEADKIEAQAKLTAATGKAAESAPIPPMVDASGKPLTGPAVLAQLPDTMRATVQAVLDGRQALPTGTATKDPYWKQVIQFANQADPNFDAVNYNARANTRKDFTSGKAAGQINAINTAIGHLHQLSGEGEKLGNFGINWVNSIYNALTPGGSARGVTLNNFNTLKEGVGTELMRVWRQVGAGSEKEIEEWKSTIRDAKSPEELKGAFQTIGGMLESKLESLDKQYKEGMGTDRVSAISPESRQRLDALQGIKSGGADIIYARDPQGNIHSAKKGTALPPGWQETTAPGGSK